MAFDSVKVVIIGQDPYHGYGQANGLAFSVNSGVKLPPSLFNIYKEVHDDVGCNMTLCGDLTKWADQGVLLLNTSLTVEAGKPASHKDIGWYPFVQGVVKLLNDDLDNLVFILWGKHAQEFENVIDSRKHQIIKSAHPSPYSADKGFFGSKPFSRTNDYLNMHGKKVINWEI
jgi:uracil-DNA glycosylase